MKFRFLCLSLASAAASLAFTQNITINPADAILTTGSVGTAKYRLSNTNFDQSLDKGSVSGAGDQVTAALGNASYLSGRTYDFTLQHLVDQGFIFTMTDVLTGTSSVVSWGTFLTPPPGANSATLGGFAPDRSFNALKLEARSTSVSGGSSSVEWSSLDFTGAASETGTFTSGLITQSEGTDTQWVISDVDFTTFDWSLAGRLTAAKAFSGGDEAVKYSVLFQNTAPVPEPSALLALGLAAAAGIARFRAKRS